MTESTSLVVVSGLSGAGKSAFLNSLEDLGFYCVDNLPPALMPTFADLCDRAGSAVERAALVVDARTLHFEEEFAAVFEVLKSRSRSVEMIFLDADDTVLQQRFSETRRPHPLAAGGDVASAIRAERERLAGIRRLASRVIDTSDYSPHELREFVFRLFGGEHDNMATINVASFAFRSGLPKNADLVFDVRFIPNPNYVAELKPLTGMDKAVSEYVKSRPETVKFLSYLESLLEFVVPLLGGEGRAYLNIAFGCTGGRHRSVVVAAHVAAFLQSLGHDVSLSHRGLPESAGPDDAREVAR